MMTPYLCCVSRRTAGAIILRIAYGYELKDINGHDPLVDNADEAVAQFSAATLPGTWLVDIIPILRHVPEWVPGANFKKLGREWNKCLNDVVETPYNFTKQQMTDGVAPPSFLSNLLENEASLTADEVRNIKWATGSLYTGGADTVRSVSRNVCVALTVIVRLYPPSIHCS